MRTCVHFRWVGVLALGFVHFFISPAEGANYSEAVLATPGLQGYWQLNETSGDFMDSGPNGFVGEPQKSGGDENPGVLYAVPGPSATNGFSGFGAVNYAAGFDAESGVVGHPIRENSAWISIPHDDRLNPGTGDFTIEAWFINDGNNPDEFTWGIIGKQETEGTQTNRIGYRMAYNYWDFNDTVVGGFRRDITYSFVDSNPGIPVAINQWHHMVTVLHRNRTEGDVDYSVSGISVFVDGELIQTVASSIFDGDPGFDISNDKPLGIGSINGIGSFAFRGSVDEVAVYQRALSPDEVAAHYAAAFIPGSADLPGDFNGDGIVDGRDFLLWQRDTTVGNLADWQANFGATASQVATSTAVPEPGGLALMLTAAYGLAIRRNRMATRNTKGPKGLSR